MTNIEPTPAPLHSVEEEATLQALYDSLKPLAVHDYIEYFLARTPAHFQADMKDIIAADLTLPPDDPAMAVLKPPPKLNKPAYPGGQDPRDYGARQNGSCC